MWTFSGNIFIFQISKIWKFPDFRFFSFSFRKFSDLKIFRFRKKRKSENFQISEIWEMKIFPEKFQNFWKYFLIFFWATVSKCDPSSRYPISRDEFRTTATIFRLFEFQLHQILIHIGPIFGQKGASGLYFSYLEHCVTAFPTAKSSKNQPWWSVMRRSCRKNSWKHVRTTFLGQLRRREGVRNE